MRTGAETDRTRLSGRGQSLRSHIKNGNERDEEV